MDNTIALDPLPATTPRWRSVRAWGRELGLLGVLYAGYMLGRAAMGVHPAEATERGHRLLELEASFALDIEAGLNALVTTVAPLGLLFAYLYATLHYLVTPVVLGWVALRRREAYPRARSALLLATAFGLLGYWLAPTAPPRLLDTGLTDTMAVFSGAGWWGDAASAPRGMESLSNQYAAMPSLHVGWAVWVALVVFRHARGPVARRLAVAYPVLMSVVVMATANHYLLDVVAGIACALVADHLCALWMRRQASGATDVTVRPVVRSLSDPSRDQLPAPPDQET